MRRINFRRIAIALVFGAAMTVLLGWYRPVDTSVIWFTRGWQPVKLDPSSRAWPIDVPADWPELPSEAERKRSRWSESLRYSHYIGPPSLPGPVKILRKKYYLTVERSGWPCRALVRMQAIAFGPGAPKLIDLGILQGGWPLPIAWRTTRLGTTIPLPLMPLWPGFAINTLFYGALMFGAMVGIPAIKRRKRFKRGLCVQCAYPLTGGNVCPECGVAVL